MDDIHDIYMDYFSVSNSYSDADSDSESNDSDMEVSSLIVEPNNSVNNDNLYVYINENDNSCVLCNKLERTQDVVLNNAYTEFFANKGSMFMGKVVLHLGFNSSSFAFMAAAAGAAKVFLIMNYEDEIINQVKRYFANHNVYHVIKPLKGPANEIMLPDDNKKVDIIACEWFGNAIFVNSNFEQIIYARDHFLNENGIIFPNKAHLFIGGISGYPEQIRPINLFDDYVNDEDLVTDMCLIKEVDLNTADEADQFIDVVFEMAVKKNKSIVGLVLYFDISYFDATSGHYPLFSTSPHCQKTSYRHTILAIDECRLNVGEFLKGNFFMSPEPNEFRRIKMGINWPSIMPDPPIQEDIEDQSDSDDYEMMDIYDNEENLESDDSGVVI